MIIKLINVLAILNLFNYNIMANACMGTSSSSATTDVGTSTEDTASTTEDTTTTTWRKLMILYHVLSHSLKI